MEGPPLDLWVCVSWQNLVSGKIFSGEKEQGLLWVAQSGQEKGKRKKKKRVRNQKVERWADIPWDRACQSFFPGLCSSLCFVAFPGDPSLDHRRRKIPSEGKAAQGSLLREVWE